MEIISGDKSGMIIWRNDSGYPVDSIFSIAKDSVDLKQKSTARICKAYEFRELHCEYAICFFPSRKNSRTYISLSNINKYIPYV